jgi:N-acetylglucosamine kinase-like BadF-type ATPase
LARAETEGGPLNPYVLSQTAIGRTLQDLIDGLLAEGGFTSDQIRGVGAGIAGVRTASEAKPIRTFLSRAFPHADNIRITHDLEIALRGGTANGTGIVIVAGTGSSAYGRDGNQAAQVGGWGHLMGDEGSGYWIGLQSLRAVAQAQDGRAEPTALREAICSGLDIASPRDLVSWSIDASKSEIAALAEITLDQARLGDSVACKIAESGAAEIARMASVAARSLGITDGPMDVVLTGGLMTAESGYFDICRRHIVQAAPTARVTPPLETAVWGAVHMARETVV